jgi:hypothetical protein
MEATMVRFLIPAVLLLATSAQADEVTGDVLAFDRVASVIVMEDKSVFTVPNPEVIPADLQAGETVTIVFKTEGENGLTSVQSITRN